MYCVGLTGRIASGKSTVAELFSALNVDIISADQIAKQITQPGEPAFIQILSHFGHSLLTTKGTLDRKALRDEIFNAPSERIWLEQLLHPLIRENIENAIQHCKGRYCIIEIPLLNDKKTYPYLDRILLVEAKHAQQIQRIMDRDHCTDIQAEAILNSQLNDSHYRNLADDIIINNGTIIDLKLQVHRLHTDYLHQSKLGN